MDNKITSFTAGLVLMLFSFGCSKKNEAQHPPNASSSFEEQLLTVLPLIGEDHMLYVEMSTNLSGQAFPVFTIRPMADGVVGSEAID